MAVNRQRLAPGILRDASIGDERTLLRTKLDKRFILSAAIKTTLALLLLGLWHGSQTLLDHAKRAMGGTSFDRGHALLAPVNNFLHHHDKVANTILIVTSGHIDLVLVGMVLWGYSETRSDLPLRYFSS
jgi:hypothetical protein